jgi:hypothetical protein
VYLARYTAAHVYALVLDEPALVWNKPFLDQLDLERLAFDPEAMRAEYAPFKERTERYSWPAGWNPEAAFRFNTPRRAPALAGASSQGAPPWTTTLR